MAYGDPFCADIPKNRPDFDNGFPGLSGDACTNMVSKLQSGGDTLAYDLMIQAYINENGIPLQFRPYLFEIDKSEKLYNEHSAAAYGLPMNIVGILDAKDSSSWMSSLGYSNEETSTIWISIRTFREKIKELLRYKGYTQWEDYSKIYNLNYISEKDHLRAIEPKPRDILQLTTYGCDREWDRGNRMYEITNVEDEIFSENFNPVMGHYVWKLTVKRFYFNMEDGTSTLDEKTKDDYNLGEQGEKGNHYISDNAELVKLINGEEDEEEQRQVHEKVYEHDVAEESKKRVFDMRRNVSNMYDNQTDQTTKVNYREPKGSQLPVSTSVC